MPYAVITSESGKDKYSYNAHIIEEDIESETCTHCGCNCKKEEKVYPSSYQYNVLIMLAKRLIKEENEREAVNACVNRWNLDRKFVRRIISA